MRCKNCKTEFTEEICPECGAKKSNDNALVFYKNVWFWVTVCVVLLWIVSFSTKKFFNFSNQVSQGEQSLINHTEEAESFFNDKSVNFKSDQYNSITSPLQKSDSAMSYSSSSAYEESSYNSSDVSAIVLDQNSVVYISPSGKRYHISAACAGKNASETTLKNAEEHDKTPCKKCIK